MKTNQRFLKSRNKREKSNVIRVSVNIEFDTGYTHTVTFNGEPNVVIPRKGFATSDIIDMENINL